MTIQDYKYDYGCQLTSDMISRPSGWHYENTLFALDSCSGDGVWVGELDFEDDQANVFAEISLSYGNFYKPFGIHFGQNDKAVLGTVGRSGGEDYEIYLHRMDKNAGYMTN